MSDSISVTIEYERVEVDILQPDFIQVNLLEPVLLSAVSLNTAHRLLVSGNPHNVTKIEVGLGNVTDDAQLKRSAGDFPAFTQKISPDIGDSVLIEDSADGWNKKWLTLEGIKDLFLSFFALISSRNDHGTITTSVTIGSETEHTMDHTGDITLNLDNLTEGNPSRALRDTVSGGGSPSITISSSQSIVFRGSDTLSGLTDGEHDILFTWDGVRVLVRVEAL